MKAAYILWPNFEFLDKLVDSGIDTLLVCAHDLPWGKSSGYYDTKEIVVQTISRYKASCKIFLVPLWVRDPIYYTVPDTQQWQTQDGRYLRKTPCPTSSAYISSRVTPAVDFYQEHHLDGLIWDLEHLTPPQYKSEIVPFYKGKLPTERCWCVQCRNYGLEDLWKVHAYLILEYLVQAGIPIHGQMPYSYGWTMRQFPGDLHHFTEETYKKGIDCWEWWKWERSWKKAEVSPKVSPGIWCEYLKTEQNLIRYIKLNLEKYGHFWLYSHEFFGNKIPNPHVDYPMRGPATDWFFDELRKI